MLQCTADAMNGFSSALQTPTDIPFLSWLFGKVSGGEPLTLLNLITLIAAVPVTIIYKIVEGSASGERVRPLRSHGPRCHGKRARTPVG
ncbi:MAG: hypothetical protein IT168_02665 [Bryobacterales bacterium]|nr:hypothetical protein [Bryobacterales bacterium]